MALRSAYLNMIPLAFVTLAVLLVIVMLHESHDRQIKGNAYNRVILCILSVTPDKRTVQHIENCYLKAENHTKSDIERLAK